MKCAFCGNENDFESLITYKQLWHLCKHCRNARREMRGQLFWEKPLPNLLFRALSPILCKLIPRLPRLLLHEDSGKNAELLYDFIGTATEEYYAVSSIKTNDDNFLQLLESSGLDLRGKTVLTLSDGPGFFAKRIQPIVKRVLTTEINQNKCCV